MIAKCTQCGADITFEQDVLFIHCEYCTSTFYVQPTESNQHLMARPHVQVRNLKKILRAYLEENHVPAADISISASALHYVPFWEWHIDGAVNTAPAYKTHISEFFSFAIPGLDYKYFDQTQIGEAVLIDATLSIVESAQYNPLVPEVHSTEVRAAKLYHLPFYHLEYKIADRFCFAWLEAGQGKVVQIELPLVSGKQKPWPELTWVIGIFALFFGEGLIFPWPFTIFIYLFTCICLYWFWLPTQDIEKTHGRNVNSNK